MERAHGSIRVTGSTGFVGRLLRKRLLNDGFPMRCMVRSTASTDPDGAETVQGDMLEPASLARVLEGIDTAHYLVHSMSGGRGGLSAATVRLPRILWQRPTGRTYGA